MYNWHTCTPNTHVHSTHMYNQHPCNTNVQLTHINNQHTCNTNVQPTHMYNHYKVYCFCKVNECYRNFYIMIRSIHTDLSGFHWCSQKHQSRCWSFWFSVSGAAGFVGLAGWWSIYSSESAGCSWPNPCQNIIKWNNILYHTFTIEIGSQKEVLLLIYSCFFP